MDHLIDVLIAVVTGVAVLTLISLGLAVIFGMMRVINFAHGEFIMLGGYTTVMATRQGVNVWVAMLVLAPLVVGLIGAVAERLIVRRFYGEIVTTMLATWGLSLFLIGLVTAIFGNTTRGVAAPLGSVAIGAYSVSAYQFVLIAITIVVTALCFLVLTRTRWGLIARGTMRNPEMASTLGIDPVRVYAATFVVGAALTGLAGGLLAPISGVIPHMGAAYVARAFVTVISGGSALIAGTVSAAGLFGVVEISFFAHCHSRHRTGGFVDCGNRPVASHAAGHFGTLAGSALMKGACIALIARYGTALLLVVLAALGPFLLSQFNLLQLSSFAAMGLATLGLELGMLLATNPILALLDEPAAGMTRDEMLKTIKLIRRLNEFATIIVVEHDLEFISLLAKRVTVLHRGAILLEDSMENVARSPLVREIYLGKQWQAKQ